MDHLIKWIDKDLEYVSKEYFYKHFFDGIELNNKEEDVFYLSNYDKGIELVLSKFKIIESIHFFGKDSTEQKEYKEELLLNISFSFSRQKVIDLLGVPAKSGGGHRNILVGLINVWDKYYFPTYSLRFEYSKDEKNILLLTVASLALESIFDIGLQ
jgi:hypothetical protein